MQQQNQFDDGFLEGLDLKKSSSNTKTILQRAVS